VSKARRIIITNPDTFSISDGLPYLSQEKIFFSPFAWIKPVPKNQLILYYNAADIILDQFVLGSWGTSTPEAMACGRPALMFYRMDYILRAFGEEPPILNSFTEDDIYSNLLRLARDKELAHDLGTKSREWIIRTHSPRVAALRHLEILQAAF
jgi:hypothetical protein